MAARTEIAPVEGGDVVERDSIPAGLREELSRDVAIAQAKLRGGEYSEDGEPTRLPEGTRDSNGKFVKGSSGNLAGRSKGIRNKITFERLALEDTLREVLAKHSPKLLEKAILMGLNGNDRIMRALLDKLLATPKHDDPGEARDNKIEVVIQSLSTKIEGGKSPKITVTPPLEKVDHEA